VEHAGEHRRVGVFATLQATEILLAIGAFREAHGYSPYMAEGRTILPVGRSLWGKLPVGSHRDLPMPRREVAGGH
jgi:hypothetical protein